MSSLDKAKDLSASSEGPDDLAVARNAPERPDAPVAGASNASAPSSAGDAGLHLQNAHFGALQVKETLTAPTADGGFGPSAAQQNGGVSESPTAPSPQTAMPEATALVNASQDAETPASAPFPVTGQGRVVETERFSLAAAQSEASAGATPIIEAPDQPAFQEGENGAPTDIDLSNATVPENAAGAVIGSLTAIDPDTGDTLRFTVSDDRFEVVDGQLKLKDGISLDHEGEPSLTISVTATDSAGHSFAESFTINVLNVNETPTDIALSNATVAENAAGAVIGTLSTLDPDAGDTHQYTVSDNRFEVVDGQLKLKDGVALDHEGEPTVTIQVTTTDAGGLTYSENFSITVENVNETPTDIALSNASVAENAAGAVIGTLSTVDPDAGDNHNYAVSDNRFEVIDGQLKLKDGVSLDYEAEPSVSIQVTTTDAGGLSYSENFAITVENVNETPTDIALSNTTVAENAAGAVIGSLSTVDPDAGDSHTYTVSDSRFEVVDGQLKLKDGVSLDYEAEPNVSVQITATDAGGLSYSENFAITVENVNEVPTDIALSNTTVAENAAGAVIGALSTVDPDAGDSHSYTVSDNRFEVVDGQLKLKDGVTLDHESEPNVSVQITATDAGGLSYTENFAITVENVNETPTDIALSNTTVAENAAGAIIGTLTAADPDAGDSHSYAVSDSRFEVVDGQLKLKDGVTLDHEAEPNVTVQITATDAGGLSYSENFSITVDNVNETPTDIALSNMSVAENTAGAVIGTLTSVDPDAGDNHTYTVSDNRFEVVDGQLKLKDGISLDHEGEPSVTIQVTTTDTGGLSFNETFTVTVANANEGPADIALSNATVAENDAGAVVGTLSTVDPDAGDSQTYSVSDSRFEVVGGELKLKDGVSLDREAEPSVTIQVTTTDAGGLSYSEDFAIGVGNVNEAPTTIALSNATVAENAAGAVVGNLTTADPDAASTHTYSVSDSRFEVIGGQLKLKTGVALDYETVPSVTLNVTATDVGGLSVTQSLTITVADVLETINGTSGNNTLNGTASMDLINGLAGNDTINGNAGDDVIVGGTGTDTLNGGAGSDTYRYTTGDGFDTYRDNGTSGTDRIVAMGANTAIGLRSGFGPTSGIEEISSGGFANVSVQGNTTSDTLNFSSTTLTGIVKIDGGSGNDTITGSTGDDTIYGGAGNDRLYGGNGNDTIVGGTGNDTLAGDAGIDTLSYAGSTAGVTVNLRTNAVSGGHAQGDTISGFENVTGSSFNDTFYGNSGANVTSGGDGNDVIHFGLTAGSDTAYGGAGTDFLQIDTAAGSAGWMQAIASGSTPALAAGDWLLQLDTGQTYVLHGSGATYDFGGVHAGVLTAADGSQMQFNEFEGVRW